MKSKPLHCWDCGQRVISIDQTGKFDPMPCLRQIRFRLSNNTIMENPFCDSCASKDWTPERIAEFRTAIIEVMPGFSKIEILAYEGITPTPRIDGVAR